MKRTTCILAIALVAAGCATQPQRDLIARYCAPVGQPTAIAGLYRNEPVSLGGDKTRPAGEGGLYHMLTQRYYSLFSCRMRPTVSTNATVLVRQCAGHRFTVSLFDNGKEVETRNVTLVQRDGYLHSQRKWRFYPLIVVNGFQNEVYAVAPDQVDNLHVFKRFYGAGGFFFLLAGTLTVEHECFHRVREPTREPKEMESQ